MVDSRSWISLLSTDFGGEAAVGVSDGTPGHPKGKDCIDAIRLRFERIGVEARSIVGNV